MLSHQGVALLERIRRIKGCGLVGGSVLLGVCFKVSIAHAKPYPLSLCLQIRIKVSIAAPVSVSMPAMLPAVKILNQTSQTESQPQ